MYIGKLGDGSSQMMVFIFSQRGFDNCIDEFVMGAGKTIEVTIRTKRLLFGIMVEFR
jgi:topoisomerase-4 subunit B